MNNLQDTKNSQTERPVDCERCNRLEDALKRANGLAEHFERAWYLRGDEIERLTAQPEQEPVTWGVDWGKAGDIPCVSIIKRVPNGGIEVMAVEYAPYSYTTPPQPQEHNFCPRCGKRNKDIHTCTPPQD